MSAYFWPHTVTSASLRFPSWATSPLCVCVCVDICLLYFSFPPVFISFCPLCCWSSPSSQGEGSVRLPIGSETGQSPAPSSLSPSPRGRVKVEEAGRRVATDGFTSGGSAAAAPPLDTLGCRQGGRGARERGCGTNQEKKEERETFTSSSASAHKLTLPLQTHRSTCRCERKFKKHYFMDFRN